MERTLVQPPCREELQGVAIGNSIEKAADHLKLAHATSAGELQWMRNVCEAPVYHPSVEEFSDPIAYIRSIRGKAEPFGVCKIVPPYPATTQCFEALRRDAGHSGNIGNLKLTTRQQLIGEKEWEDWGEDRCWGAPDRSLKAFHQAADATATKVFDTCLLLPPRRVEEEFWKRMAKPTKANSSSLYVEYGDNVPGTGFLDVEGDLLGSSLWNLNKFHASADARNPLKLLQTPIAGITTPHVYHGALFSTSHWVVEDLYLLGLNFLHIGAPKTWYAVPAQHADSFEKAVQGKVYARMCSKMRDLGATEEEVRQKVLETLARKSTVMSPEHLVERGIPITRTDQASGEFVVTFSKTYHLGFSHGINLGESINFALTEWYEYGYDAALRLTFLRKPPALPVEQMACVDMLTLAERLKANADAAAGQDFRGWLLGPGASTLESTSIPLLVAFCRLIRWYHRNISKFLADGLTMHRQAIDISVPCCVSGELMHVAAIMPERAHEPISLRHCLLTASKDPSSASKGVLLLHEKWEVYQELAQMFGELCLKQGWGAINTEEWKLKGLTDRLNISSSKSSPCWEDLSTPYCWQLDDSSPLHSAWSSNEFLPRASDKDGTLLPVFEAIYPDAAVDVPVVAAPSKTTAGAKRCSSKGGRGGKKVVKGGKEPVLHATRAQTPEVTDGDPSPHATTAKSSGQATPMDATPASFPLAEGDAPRKRASRASKNAAMASWKANKMLDEDDDADDDSRSEDGTRQSRRSKKLKREESLGALQAAKPVPGLSKVYSNVNSIVPQEYQTNNLAGKDTSGGSPLPSASLSWPTPGSAGIPLSDFPPHSQAGSHAALPHQSMQQQQQNQHQQQHVQQQQQQQAVHQQQQVQKSQMSQSQMTQQQLGQQGQAWSGGACTAARPRSQSLSPISNYNAFHAEQDRWRRSVSEVNNQWVQKLQECAKTNADVQNLLRYYMSLPDVAHVYPVSADARSMGPMAPAATAASGGAPSAGGIPGGNGAASVGALQNGSGALQGSGALSGSTLPMQQSGNAQRRTLQGQAMNAWPPNSARKESLHNGPISAQDLATSIRGRPPPLDDSRQNGVQGRNVMGAANMQAPGVNPTAATAATSAVAGNGGGNPSNVTGGHSAADGRTRSMQGVHRSSATNLPHSEADPGAASLAQEQSASHVSPNIRQPGGALPSLGLHGMEGQPQSPMLQHSPAGTPRSGLEDIINGTRNSDFHDFLSSLGDHDDVDLGMEF